VVRIRHRTVEELLIEVDDDGIGMASGERAAATGVGLILVDSLAEQMGGRMETVPRERGTCVRVSCRVETVKQSIHRRTA
jgi:signal transduction histidine kinase